MRCTKPGLRVVLKWMSAGSGCSGSVIADVYVAFYKLSCFLMLVSHRKQFIYVKTMKTASTSVESFFEPFCLPPGRWQIDVFNSGSETSDGIVGYRGTKRRRFFGLIRRRWYDHMPAKLIKRQLPAEIWNSYFKFCVVRNPFDKAISAFHFHAWMEQRGFSKMVVPQTECEVERFRNWIREVNSRHRSLLVDRDCYCINDELCTDHVIRFQDLTTGIHDVCRRLDIERSIDELPAFVSGVRPKRSLHEYYDENTKESVHEMFDFEIRKFGYEFPRDV